MDRLHPRFLILCLVAVLVGCGKPVTDPVATLADSKAHSSRHRKSIELLRNNPERSHSAATDALQGLVYRPGYADDVRLDGLDILLESDRERLVRTTRQRLSRIDDPLWLETYCEWLGDQDWSDPGEKQSINEALVSSWGVWWSVWTREEDRPERAALVKINGEKEVIPLVFEIFKYSNKASQQGLRNRCWELLHRLGHRGELIDLVEETPPESGNSMMVDLKAAVNDFGTVPYNREEILWLRKLRQPERSEFWEEARIAVQDVPESRRRNMEIRDLAIVVAAYKHRPELLMISKDALYQQVDSATRNLKHHYESEPGMPSDGSRRERLRTHIDKLTWGDLAAISIAMEALSHSAIRSHLFDYAERDRKDEGTEYGGIIQLDEQGRFELREFPPKIRHHDRRFNASQHMFDAGYTSLYHMHFHAQRHGNSRHAGPGLGDLNYADNTRTNNLVFTFVDEDTMNVDFYRHDKVIVDLGTINRPGSG
ncbi:MAG: hypothetical protein VX527_00835 [Planctomycetota bacterium]|nr:hypothetical protein [Planctomycetota bacterium]